MSKMRKKLIVTLAVLAMGSLIISATFYFKPLPVRTEAPPPPRLTVDIQEAQPQPYQLYIHSQGTVTPKREIDLVAQVSGRIEAVADNFANGGFFAQGDMLIQIEAIDHKLTLVNAQARVAQAEEQLAIERGRARQAKREWRELGDEEANALFLRKPQLKAAKASLASAFAERDRAQLNVARTTINTPFRGRVRNTLVNVGQYVSLGSRLASIYSTDTVQVRLPLSEREAQLVELPSAYLNPQEKSYPHVVVESRQDGTTHQWHGRITRTDASIDLESRMTFAVVEIKDPRLRASTPSSPPLEIGRFIEAKIRAKVIADVVLIPRHALIQKDLILTVSSENTLQFSRTEVIQTTSNEAILTGVAKNTRIVTTPVPNAYRGMPVNVRIATLRADGDLADAEATVR
ncbi:MAG TPA: efflux transporter periplasmic adaptor subunit [Porticoccaceae bacterium]|nr:efflux transporter periplasmic adaptor subunit [Porticoccaceae bacterium]